MGDDPTSTRSKFRDGSSGCGIHPALAVARPASALQPFFTASRTTSLFVSQLRRSTRPVVGTDDSEESQTKVQLPLTWYFSFWLLTATECDRDCGVLSERCRYRGMS